MGIISWILLGLIAGVLAKLIMPGDDPGGFMMTIVIGIAGALIGGLISSALGYGKVDAFNFSGIAIATGGSIVLLIIYRMLHKQKS
jgi:uncharacterized membrane protein YeaQ/YmgE (transglycosylase-associated protein family)